MKRMTSNEYNPCFNCNFYSSCSHIRENFPVCPERARYDRLAAYEETGLEPEEIELLAKQRDLYVDACGELPLKRIRELAQADRDGRCVVLNMPRKPLVWGDDDQDTCLCPYCSMDLMGIPYGERMVLQCPECGQYLDATKVITREEAEAALRREQE